jgi:hypothetical protein
MTISFACPGCGEQFNVSEDLAGKKGRCYRCSSNYVIPYATVEAPTPGKGSIYGLATTQAGVQRKKPPRVKYPTLYEDRIASRARSRFLPLAFLLVGLLGVTAYLHRDFLYTWFTEDVKEEIEQIREKVHGEHGKESGEGPPPEKQ